MGKIEQACRFRLESGYGISARSEGVTTEQEKAIGDSFNDSMNNLFPELGSSILSCTIRGRYALYARNTLKTDIFGRMTIFTHSYLFNLEDYGNILCSHPEQILGIPMSRLMDSRGGESVLPSLELEDLHGQAMDRDTLFEKYGLNDPERYTLLLTGAYEALSTGRSLRLYLGDKSGTPEQMVRELVFCITEGLVSSLRRRITFSSGGDARMSISILRGRERSAGGEMVYDVFGNARMNVKIQDKLKLRLFEALGHADREGRKRILRGIEEWLEKHGAKNCTAGQVLAAAYVEQFVHMDENRRHRYLDKDLRFLMFRAFAAAAGKSLTVDEADERLCELLEEMKENGGCSVREISNIAEWYLMDSTDLFRKGADEVIVGTSAEIKLALLDAVLGLPKANNKAEMICTLVDSMGQEEFQERELKLDLIRWIMWANEEKLRDSCLKLVNGLSNEDLRDLGMEALAGPVTKDDGPRKPRETPMTGVAAEVAVRMVGRYKTKKLIFGPGEHEELDRSIPLFDQELKESYADYLVKVRLPDVDDVDDKVHILSTVVAKDAEFGMIVGRQMSESPDREAWECFVTAKELPDGISRNQLEAVLCKYRDNFKADGVYEGRVEELLLGMYDRELQQEQRTPQPLALGTPPVSHEKAEKTETFLKWVDTHNFAVTGLLKKRLMQELTERFWNSMTLEEIVLLEKNKILDKLLEEESKKLPDQKIQIRYELWKNMGRMKTNPSQQSTVKLIECLKGMPRKDAQIRVEWLIDVVSWLGVYLICTHNVLPFDLLLPHVNRFGSWSSIKRKGEKLREYLHDCQKVIDSLNSKDAGINVKKLEILAPGYKEGPVTEMIRENFPKLKAQLESFGEPPAITRQVIGFMMEHLPQKKSGRPAKPGAKSAPKDSRGGFLGGFFRK